MTAQSAPTLLVWQPLWVGTLHHGVHLTPAAQSALTAGGVDVQRLLDRHGLGDPGWLPVCEQLEHERAYRQGRAFRSVWSTGCAEGCATHPRVCITTDAGHHVTTVRLADEHGGTA